MPNESPGGYQHFLLYSQSIIYFAIIYLPMGTLRFTLALSSILFLLPTFVELAPTHVPPQWVGSSNYQTGSVSTTDTAGNITVTFVTPFSEQPQKMATAFISHIGSAPTSTTYNISLTSSITLTQGVIKFAYSGGMTFTSLSIRYLAISKSVDTISCNGGVNFESLASNFGNVKTGSGTRQCTGIGNFTAGTGQIINLAHTNIMVLWFEYLTMYTVSGKRFQFNWTYSFLNINQYAIDLTVFGNTTITGLYFSRLIYDQTAIQSSQTIYLDGGYLYSTGNWADLSRTFEYMNLSSFMVGLSCWSSDDTQLMNWAFNVNSISTSGSMTIYWMTIAYWNYRYRICEVAHPYYNQTDNLCYDACDVYYFANVTASSCTQCHYSCYNCSGTQSNQCIACNPDDHRALSSGTCPCLDTYYDNSVSLCPPCVLPCVTCNSSTYCLSCSDPSTTHRSLSAGQCICPAPYVDVGPLTCQRCDQTLTACTACTSPSVCTSCDSSLFYTLSATTHTCVCSYGYVLYGGSCVKCSDYIQGCANCSSTTTCTTCNSSLHYVPDGSGQCKCDTGYYNTSTTCDLCSNAITGCLTCSSGSVCLTCNTVNLFSLAGSICVCPVGRYINSSTSTCDPCSIMPNCLACTSGTYCTSCDSASKFIAVSGNCVCMDRYYLDSGICKVCSTGCLICTITACTTCDTGNYFVPSAPNCSCVIGRYYSSSLLTCDLCQNAFDGCLQCSSIACTKCDQTLYRLTPAGTCECLPGTYNNSVTCLSCQPLFVGCLQCNSSNCSVCDNTAHYTNDANGYRCECEVGYVSNNGQCQDCGVLVYGCYSCSSLTVCDSCDSSNFFTSDGSGGCECQPGYFDTSLSSCQACSLPIPGCTECDIPSLCLACDTINHFYLVNGQCQCLSNYYFYNGACQNCSISCLCPGYYRTNGQCHTVCGDKILTTEFQQCDDGNLIDSDGCSSSCKLEKDFKCVTVGSYSSCSYTGTLDIELTSWGKNSYCNCLTFVLNIQPKLATLSSLDFSSIIVPNLPLYNPTYTYKDGVLSISYEYNTTLQLQNLSLQIAPSGNPNFTDTPNSVINLQLLLPTNEPILPYNQSTYDTRRVLEKIYTGLVIGSYFTFLLSMFTNKIVGLEMMGVLQVAFFVLADFDFLHPLLAPLIYFKYVNGFNMKLNLNGVKLPIPVQALDYNSEFMNNVNIMLLLPAACLLISLILYLIGRFGTPSESKVSVLLWSKKLLKQYLLTAVMFSTYNIAFSTGIQTRYSSASLFDILINVAALVFIAIVIGLLKFSHCEQFGEFKLKFNDDFMAQSYFVISFIYRVAIGMLMAYQNDNPNITMVNTFLSIVFLMYLLSNLPYTEGYHNYRAAICQISIITVFFITMYYRSMKQNTPLDAKGYIVNPAFFQILVIAVSIVTSVVILCYQIVQWIKQLSRTKPKEAMDSRKQTATQEAMNVSYVVIGEA